MGKWTNVYSRSISARRLFLYAIIPGAIFLLLGMGFLLSTVEPPPAPTYTPVPTWTPVIPTQEPCPTCQAAVLYCLEGVS